MTTLMTKRQAVEQMIDGAMRANEGGQHACAITLAAAAEDAIPDPSESYLFTIARDAFAGTNADPVQHKKDKKEVVSQLNAERD